jgi:hypothetical protein
MAAIVAEDRGVSRTDAARGRVAAAAASPTGWTKAIFDVVTITRSHRRRLAARVAPAAPIAVPAAIAPAARRGLTGAGHFKY